MSHSITTTVSYVLNKYSRSYPSTGAQASAEPEWQHFTNPVMRITLEAKKSPSGQLLSLRLRIPWSLHAEFNDSHVDQREVVFVRQYPNSSWMSFAHPPSVLTLFNLQEDLELLSFSSLLTSGAQSDQSLPLKAVYRDAVVGVRYLHPRTAPPGSQPASDRPCPDQSLLDGLNCQTYRRFQITFKDAQDTSQCIDAIKSVCPCKANPHPTPLLRHPATFSTSLTRTATTQPDPVPAGNARLVSSTMPSPHPDNQLIAIAPSSVAASLSSDDSAFVTCSETSHRTDARVDHRKDGLAQNREIAQGSLPNSSQLSSSDQSTTMPPPPVPRRAGHESPDAMTQEAPGTVNTGDERSQLLASLSRHPSLYELSQTDLETLVSQVIREEGFLRLLESLDSLWRVKGFLGH